MLQRTLEGMLLSSSRDSETRALVHLFQIVINTCLSRSRVVQALSFGTLQTSFHILAREEESPQKNDGRVLSDRSMARNQLS